MFVLIFPRHAEAFGEGGLSLFVSVSGSPHSTIFGIIKSENGAGQARSHFYPAPKTFGSSVPSVSSERIHPFSFRTRQLSSLEPMVVVRQE